ncbi:MAG TPA: hypothetical protein VIH58_06655 [Chthoniobacterales bacterium]|jgi:hypothetical protein
MKKIHFLIAAAAILLLGGCAGDGVVASYDGPYVGDGWFGGFGGYYGGHYYGGHHFFGHGFGARHFSGGHSFGGFHGGGFHGGGHGGGGGGHR